MCVIAYLVLCVLTVAAYGAWTLAADLADQREILGYHEGDDRE